MARPRGRKNVRYLFLCHGAPNVTIFRRPGVSGISLYEDIFGGLRRSTEEYPECRQLSAFVSGLPGESLPVFPAFPRYALAGTCPWGMLGKTGMFGGPGQRSLPCTVALHQRHRVYRQRFDLASGRFALMPTPLHQARRCGARTRSGRPCRSPAVHGRPRCRMHGCAPGADPETSGWSALGEIRSGSDAVTGVATLFLVSNCTLASWTFRSGDADQHGERVVRTLDRVMRTSATRNCCELVHLG